MWLVYDHPNILSIMVVYGWTDTITADKIKAAKEKPHRSPARPRWGKDN
jgi:hypothetical protein